MADEIKAAKHDLSALRINRDAPRRGTGRLVVVVAILAVSAGAGLTAWHFTAGARQAPLVETALVRRVGGRDAGAVLSASGYILPERRANISSKVFGRLEWIGVDVGSIVRKDDVIARLAGADLKARVEEARVALADARREHERWKRMVEEGVAERERLDRARTHLDLSEARLRSAEAEFGYMEIRAPFDGIVVRKHAEIGETVGPASGSGSGSAGNAIVTLVDPTSLEMVADVNETNIAKVRAGQAVEVVTDAHPDRTYRGTVRQIVPTADRQKGVVQVKVRLLERDERLMPELAARATFLRDAPPESGGARVMVPRAAVRERAGRSFVLVVEGTRVRGQAVETGIEGEDGVEIRSGLAGGELVVVGGEPVADGQTVRIAGRP